jgi:LysM repeat protein
MKYLRDFYRKNTNNSREFITFAQIFYRMRNLIVSITLLTAFQAQAQISWNQTYQQYIDQYKDIAIEQMQRYHIPASITLAQGIFESGAGRSELALKGNNHFGIKCNGWSGRRIYHDDDERGECFRSYDNAFESYEDHSKFLVNGQRYRSLFQLKITDYKGWAKGLKAAGYATNPQYAQKLIDIIQLYKLYRYDTAKDYDKFMADHTKSTTNSVSLHAIKIFNKNYYLIARRGDTFKSIADEIGISDRKLAKFNERDRRDALEEGEIIWLKKKQTKAPKDYKGRLHYVRQGDSMYSIAQKYGIRLKNLYKMNKLSPDYQIKLGDALRLR